MADNFNLRQFLSENKLTKNAKLIKEGSDYGFEALMDAADDMYPEGTPENGKLVFAIEKALHSNSIDTSEFGHDLSAATRAVEAIANEIGLGDEQANDIEQAQHDMERQFESKLTAKERRLVEMVQDALGLEGYGDDNVRAKLEKRGEVPVEEPTYTEGEEMVKEKPLPKYESIEQLMKEIEHGTNEAAHKYKMEEMKRVYEALEAKVSSLEEGENAEHIDQKKVKQMRKDIAALRKAEEKLRKEFDKKFSDKEKKEAPKKEKEDVTLAENKKRNTMKNFDLKKFLTENKLTTNSRMLTEQAQYKDGDTVDIEGDNWRVYKAFSGNKDNMAAALEFVKQNIQILPFEQWYEGEFGGGRPVRTSEPVYILTGMDEKGMGIEHGPQIVLQDDIDDGYLSYGNTGELEGDYQDEL